MYLVDLSIIESLEDCVNLSIVAGLAGGLDDGGNRLLSCVKNELLGAFPERLARATAAAYCIMVNIK